jgi:hypothetical protein
LILISNQNLKSILTLQKKAVRIMLNLDNRKSVKNLFSQLNLLTVNGKYIFKTVMCAKTSEDSLAKLGSTHNYNTRHRNYPAIKKHHLEFYNKKPSASGVLFLYHLPRDIYQITDINLFKRKLKIFLVIKPIYSFDEFFLK